ncbi:STAGA complex 65 subunit gamma-like [Diorhabda carinulata]|uniref:STAGA complex 65 subunit gamma-like n=1 Tax=Diorhabda carinulata TaxID=1163345 RepID=UPI0025A20557|nr:STAGA complex 65 subunit gamma-like [Diorhabda carinulata]
MTTHWGEIEPKPASVFTIPDITTEIEKSMDKFCLSEFDDEVDREKVEDIVLPPIDPLVSYAISLHKYANDMTEMIRVAELATEMNLIPPEDAAPPMPLMPEVVLKHKRNKLNFIPQVMTPFTSGKEVEFPELSEAVVKNLLKKSICAMFAHVGYETTHQSVLDTMTDVLETFLQTFCHKVVEYTDSIEHQDIGFSSIIEKVLIETGMGGVRGLHDYYQNRVIRYIDVLKKRCVELNEHYAALLIPKSPSPTNKFNSIVRVKVEEDENVVEVENPELHFASFEGDASVIESGLQLLHSLEAVENLQSLENGTEEVIATTSNIVTVAPEGEMCNLLPHPKKKRL